MKKYIVFGFNQKVIVLTVLFILILASATGAIQSKELSIKEAIQWGVENNYDLQNIRNNITELERSLDILDAAESFQVDLSATPIWYFGKGENDLLEMSENSLFMSSAEVNLTATKRIADNISLSTELAWESDSLTQMDFNEMLNEINANIKLAKQIYPDTWTENEKQVYSIKNSLQMKLEELRWEEIEKQIEFIQNYLHIIRLRDERDIVSERVKLAEETLTRVKKQIELGEGGYQQQTEAEIALREAGNQMLNLEQSLSQAKKQWFLALCLPKDRVVQFENNTDFMQGLFSRIDTLDIDLKTQEDLIHKALEGNYQIKNSQLEKEGLIKELEWTEDEGKPIVGLSGGYQYPDNWFIMVDFSVNLSDGGAQQLKEEQKEMNIKQKEVSITYLMEQLKLKVEQLLNQDQYNQLYLDTQLLVLGKEQDKFEIVEKQYQLGAISKTQWHNELLILKEKEIKMKEAEDQWFINRLKLVHFLGELKKEI